jgi:hypothetical protein
MPIRKTQQGWYWGSKGPFLTKAKALQVARAAHASGFIDHANDAIKPKVFRVGMQEPKN